MVGGAQRVFKVYNVDETGQEHNAGKIEISETELVLRQHGKPAYRWPLRSLRRYGFDAELFSFESGRRCPTGPGIYAFRCQRAEALFNLLQDCIQRAGQEPDPAVEAAPPGGTLAATAAPDEPTAPEAVNANSLHLYVNSSLSMMADADPAHEYVNTYAAGAGRTDEHCIQYAELDLPRGDRETPSHGQDGGVADDAKSDGSPVNMYMNMPALGGHPGGASGTTGDSGGARLPHSYANLGLLSASTTRVTPAVKPPATKVNYIELDLQNGAGGAADTAVAQANGIGLLASNGLTSPARQTDSYAMIDFHKTAALNAKTTAHDEGERKTRHNSNIDDLLISD